MKAVGFHGVGDIRVDDVPESFSFKHRPTRLCRSTSKVLPQVEPLSAATDAAFDSRRPGWIKVELKPDVAMVAAM